MKLKEVLEIWLMSKNKKRNNATRERETIRHKKIQLLKPQKIIL